jgi:hypothetical protein
MDRVYFPTYRNEARYARGALLGVVARPLNYDPDRFATASNPAGDWTSFNETEQQQIVATLKKEATTASLQQTGQGFLDYFKSVLVPKPASGTATIYQPAQSGIFGLTPTQLKLAAAGAVALVLILVLTRKK